MWYSYSRKSMSMVSSFWLFVVFAPYAIITKIIFIRVFVMPDKVRKTAYRYW